MARPSTDPFTWATNAGRREAPTPGDQASGAVGGLPVPALKNNGLLGNIFDWLNHLVQPSVRSYPIGSLPWTWNTFNPVSDMGENVNYKGATSTDSSPQFAAYSAGRFATTRPWGGGSPAPVALPGFEYARWLAGTYSRNVYTRCSLPRMHPGGTLGSVTLKITDAVDPDGTLQVLAFDEDGHAGFFTLDLTTVTGAGDYSATLFSGTATFTSWVHAVVLMNFTGATAEGDLLEATYLNFNFT